MEMNKKAGIVFLGLLTALSAGFLIQIKGEEGEGEDHCALKGTAHEDNNPSSKTFYKLAYSGSLCEIAICVDVEQCTNHDAVNWDKFTNSPAYVNAGDEEQKAMDHAHSDGVGAPGLTGYEILDYVVKDNHDKS